MATRFNVDIKTGNKVDNGYKGVATETIYIPTCGIEDVDTGVFDLFDKELELVTGDNQEGFKKTPVLFASGEKWALLKKGKALRDKSGVLILPLITITRNGFNQSDITQRGINQFTGVINITRKLNDQDSNYQNLINRLLVKSQSNVAKKIGSELDGVETRREIGELSNDIDIKDGKLLQLNKKNRGFIYEIISIPSPQFFQLTYEVTFWNEYTQHTNQMVEKLFSSLLPHGNCFRIETRKGYWFVATIEGGSVNYDTNFQDMSSEERYIKTTFTLTVPAYLLAGEKPGELFPIRKQVISPKIEFGFTDPRTKISGSYTEEDDIIKEQDPTMVSKLKSISKDSNLDHRTSNELDTYISIEENKNKIKRLRKKRENKYRIIDDRTGLLINDE